MHPATNTNVITVSAFRLDVGDTSLSHAYVPKAALAFWNQREGEPRVNRPCTQVAAEGPGSPPEDWQAALGGLGTT